MNENNILDFLNMHVAYVPGVNKWRFKDRYFSRKGQAEKAACKEWSASAKQRIETIWTSYQDTRA